MKAWVLHDIGDIRYEDVPNPKAAAGYTLVRVGAAGICGSDIPRIYDTGAHNMPLIPGHEFAGTVEGTGKRVGVFPLIPCRRCPQCLDKHFELCRNYDYLGSRSDGAFAEYVNVPKENLIELPDNVSMEEAAMLEPMSVAVHAIRQAMDIDHTDRKKRIAVYGLGTIGLFMAMFLKAEGFDNIIVIGNKDSQKKKTLALGIPEENYFDGRKDILSDADIVFECVGKSETYEISVAIARPMGTVVTVDNPYSDMTLKRDTYWKILRNQLTIKGTWNSSFTGSEDDDWHYVLNSLKDKKIDPTAFISHRYDLCDLNKGLEIMRDKKEEYGKIMICSREQDIDHVVCYTGKKR